MDDQNIPVLEVKDIVKRFGGLVAVNKVSMEVAPGEVVAFPLAASQTIVRGDLIAVADGGLVRNGNDVSNVWILGKAMFDVTSTSTVNTSTVKFVPVWVDVYYKSS